MGGRTGSEPFAASFAAILLDRVERSWWRGRLAVYARMSSSGGSGEQYERLPDDWARMLRGARMLGVQDVVDPLDMTADRRPSMLMRVETSTPGAGRWAESKNIHSMEVVLLVRHHDVAGLLSEATGLPPVGGRR